MKIDRDKRKLIFIAPLLIILLFAGILYLNIIDQNTGPAAEESGQAPTSTPTPIPAPTSDTAASPTPDSSLDLVEKNIVRPTSASPPSPPVLTPTSGSESTILLDEVTNGGTDGGANPNGGTDGGANPNGGTDGNSGASTPGPASETTSPTTTTIPEYPTIAVPIGIALGMMFIVSHLKNKK